jgi:Domain of Unknown Function (DUF928)
MRHQPSGFWRNSRTFTSLVVGVLFLVTAALPVSAQYKPRDRKPASGNSRAGGSRGCSSNGIPLTQLAPQTFVGKTASTRPMLSWYMSSSQNVRFRLFKVDPTKSVKQIGQFQEIPTRIGINQLKLPLDYPELTVGKTYLWQIVIDCNNDTILNQAEFTVIQPQSLPKNQFATIPERVNYYAENELWYEALEEALKETHNNGKLGVIAATLVQDLAQSEMPTGSESHIDIKNIQRRIGHLQKIASQRAKDSK